MLDVPTAYLLADNASMADAILELSKADQQQQANLASAIKGLTTSPTLTFALLELFRLPEREQAQALRAFQSLLSKTSSNEGA